MAIQFLNNVNAGSGVLYVDAVNSKVGIGTTSPSRKLQVIGTDGVAKFYYNSSFTNAQYSVLDIGMMTSGTAANGFGPKITFRMGGNGYDGYAAGTIGTVRNGADNTHNLNFATSNSGSMTTKMTITNDGKVGIGTASPTDKLTVENGNIRLNSTSSYPSQGLYAYWNNGSPNMGGISWRNDPGFVGSEWIHNKQSSPYTQARVRMTGDANGNFNVNLNNSQVFTILASNGNVGVGTTAPGAKLEVNGNSRFVGEMQFFQGSTSNKYLQILQSSGSTFINTGTSGETIYFGAPSSNTTNLSVQGTGTFQTIANATSDTDKFLVSDSGVIKYRTGAQLASDIGAVTGGPFLPLSGGTLTGDLSIPEYLYHAGDSNTYLRFQSDSIELYTGGWKVFGNTTLKYGALYGDNALRVYATQAGGYVNGSLEVSDYVKAVEGYKGYVSDFNNGGFFHSPRSSDGANPLWIPINTTGMSSSDQYYNTWVPLYAGRVRKIIIKHISGSTPVATACTFRKKINGTLSGTTYAGTVTGGGAAGMKVTFDFGTTNFTFNAEDEVQIGVVTGVATQPRMGGMSYQIWYEYNIT